MKISVIVPVYNAENYLSACLDSILSQTYQNFEIILINDGSKDASGRICDEYAKRDPRIRVVHQENHGVSHARNVGLAMAEGDAISFIDSDDTLEPDMYELLAKVMEEYSADISHCGYKHIVGQEIRLVHDTKRIIPQSSQEALDYFVSGRLFGGGLWNKLFRKDVIAQLRFREDLKINEDILFNFEAFMTATRTVFADYAKYNYIAHFGTSAVFKTPDEKKISDSCQVAEHIYKQLAGTALNDVATERYIRALSGYYQFCAEHKLPKLHDISAKIQKVAASANTLGRNMTITVKLIKYFPWLYRIVIAIYKKVRKPRWEARKD